jgi:hypothetical protein
MLRINWTPPPRELRSFGVICTVFLTLVGSVLAWRVGRTPAYWLYGSAVLMLIITFEAPPVLLLGVYRGWMAIGYVIGSVVSRVILVVIFFLVITPVAFVFKIMGRDVLRIKRAPSGSSYWVKHPHVGKESYRHLF